MVGRQCTYFAMDAVSNLTENAFISSEIDHYIAIYSAVVLELNVSLAYSLFCNKT